MARKFEDKMAELKCKKHPKYKAMREPKSCDVCLVIWTAKKVIKNLEK